MVKEKSGKLAKIDKRAGQRPELPTMVSDKFKSCAVINLE